MDVRHLKVFLAIVDSGGITRAAEELHVSQPSVSQTLRALERECGVELFHRIGRGMKISAAGEALVGPARHVLRSLETVTDQVVRVAHLQSGRLDIGAHSTLATDPLGEIVGRFHKRYPGVTMRILDSNDARGLLALIRDGSCEVGLSYLPLKAHDLIVEPLGKQELHVILPPGTPEGSGPLTIAELAKIPLVVPPVGSPTRELLDKAFADAGVKPHIVLEASTRERTLPFVLAGVGATLYPSTLAKRAFVSGVVVRFLRPRITREIALVSRPRQLSPAARAFVEHLRSADEADRLEWFASEPDFAAGASVA